MNIKDIYWHDGRFKNIELHGTGEFSIMCQLYKAEDSKEREIFKILCSNVKSVVCTIDLISIIDNAAAGNLTAGKISQLNDTTSQLKIFLADGYIEVLASDILLEA